MVSMVPRNGVRGFRKWLNGQSIKGSSGGPFGLAHVAIRGPAGYVNASRAARGWGQLRNDYFEPNRHKCARHAVGVLARHVGGVDRGIGLRGAGRLLGTVPEGLYSARWRARANPDRRQPGSGADRDGNTVHRGNPERRGVLLHIE